MGDRLDPLPIVEALEPVLLEHMSEDPFVVLLLIKSELVKELPMLPRFSFSDDVDIVTTSGLPG